MKQRFLFIRLLWDVLRGKESGWVFFKLTDQQQVDVLAGDNKGVIVKFNGGECKSGCNCVEVANNKRLGMIMAIISFGGCLAFLVGLVGILICKL